MGTEAFEALSEIDGILDDCGYHIIKSSYQSDIVQNPRKLHRHFMRIIHKTPEILIIEQKPAKSIAIIYPALALVLVAVMIFMGVLALTRPSWHNLLLVILFSLFMIMIRECLMETSVTLCTLDKKANLLTLKQRNWFGEKLIRHHLNEIRDAQITASVASDGEYERVEVYEIGLILHSGAYLQLNKPIPPCDRHCTQPIFASLRGFLNL